MNTGFAKLEQILGYRFNDAALLERSLTHRSWAHEQLPKGSQEEVRRLQNESLEFLGDAVLGLAVVEYLMEKYPGASEGELTLMKHRLVSTGVLAKTAETLGLGEYLKIGRGEEKTGGRKKQALLADVMEAVIAAIFLDGGYVNARAFVQKALAKELKGASPNNSSDYKTMLQENLQAAKKSAPIYRLLGTEGPPHNRIFSVEATWDGGTANATGNSIKSAEMAAASEALRQLNEKQNIKKIRK